MGKIDPRVDAYIAKSADFAKPVLRHLRKIVHAGCPDVEETLKWGFPHFMHDGIVCGMASFKRHCAFYFRKYRVPGAGAGRRSGEAMGQFGRITAISDLPAKRTLVGFVREAAALNEQCAKQPAPPKVRTARAPRPVQVPADLVAALRKNARARTTFEAFSPSHQREYIEWITGAKRDETRARRLATALEWMAEGKPQNWRYLKK